MHAWNQVETQATLPHVCGFFRDKVRTRIIMTGDRTEGNI